jgi:hypothetical protein
VASSTVGLKDLLPGLHIPMLISKPDAGLPENNGHRHAKTERQATDYCPNVLMHRDGNPSSRLAPILIPAKDSNPSQWMP